MRAIILPKHGGPDQLTLRDWPTPTARAGEILVAVKACGLNHLDVFVRRGMPGQPTALPHIGGSDIAGEVAACGPGVDTFEVGQRVLLDPLIVLPDGRSGTLGEDAHGGLAEYITVPAENAIPLPAEISFRAAAALPIAYGTAHRMLVTRGKVQPGEQVLVLGASGGVGTAAVQIAKLQGGVVFAAASTDEKLQALRALGADVLLNYTQQPAFHRFVRSHTNGAGVDVVLNYTGGDTWVRSLKSLKHGGRMITCGATAGFDPRTDIRFIWRKEIDIRGSDGWRRADLLAVLELVRTGKIRPVIDRTLPLEQVAEAHRLLERRAVFGKIVIEI